MNYLWIDWMSMSDFFLDFCCFSLFIILTTWKICIFTFLFCFWNKVNFSLMFLSLIMLICQWMSEFNLRTVRAIAKSKKNCANFNLCFWFTMICLCNSFKNQNDNILLKRMLFIFRRFIILVVVYRREKSKSEIYILSWFLMILIVL